MSGRLFIARHGETIFNQAMRVQGDVAHTPLTRAGFAQADRMAEALLDCLGPRPELELWSSPSGRALQTLAVISEHLQLDWHSARVDQRLSELAMGAWSGRYMGELTAEQGEIFDPDSRLFVRPAPGGETYRDVAERLRGWLAEQDFDGRDALVVMHGQSSRVLRGLLRNIEDRPGLDCPIADPLPQGSIACIESQREWTLPPPTGGGWNSDRPRPT